MMQIVYLVMLMHLTVAEKYYWDLMLLQKLSDSAAKEASIFKFDDPINYTSTIKKSSTLPLTGFENVSID